MIRPTNSLGLTHYHAPTQTAFAMDKCETCGGDVQQPNAVGLGPVDAAKLRLIKVDKLPPEIWYNEDTDMTDCDDCH